MATSIGFSFLDTRLAVFGEASLGGENNQVEREGEESRSLDLPVPLLGIHGTWGVRPHLVLRGNAEYLYIDYDKYTGSYFDARLDLVYYPFNHFGFGLGYNFVDFDVDVEGRIKDRFLEFSGLLRYSVNGFRAFATVSF